MNSHGIFGITILRGCDWLNKVTIRTENENDHREVEELTRKAFWREERIEKIGIGCNEHYMVHRLRKENGIMELNLVAEIDGQIVGHVIYSRAHILKPDGVKFDVINFGPLSVLPEFQKQGVGSALMEYSIKEAKRLGYGGILFFGHPTYYPRFGFVEAKEFDIKSKWGNFPAFMAMELKEGFFKDVTGTYVESEIYDENATKELAAEYDRKFLSQSR